MTSPSRRLVSLLALLGLSLAFSTRAQDDRRAGLFTEARQLPVLSQSLAVEVVGGEARLTIIQSFFNDGTELAQADYHLHLPREASVVGFGFWNDGTFFSAELEEKETAERDHAQAADEGRASGIVRTEGNGRIQTLSVVSLAKDEAKKVRVELMIPLVRELGRSRLRLPVDAFLGQPAPETSVRLDLLTEAPLADLGVDGADPIVVTREKDEATLVFSTRRPAEAWWTVEGPPLAIAAETVSLGEDGTAIELRVALDDASEWAAPVERVHVVVDESLSMQRRQRAVDGFLERLDVLDVAPVEVQRVGAPRAAWRDLARALGSAECSRSDVTCAIVTDAQLPGLAKASTGDVELVVLADVHEAEHFRDVLPDPASLVLDGVDSEGRLLALADRLVLPVLEVGGASQAGHELEWMGTAESRTAEGGMLRLRAVTDSRQELDLKLSIDGTSLARSLFPGELPVESERGRALRRRFYRDRLADWMDRYRAQPSEELKKQVVAISLREGIPTAFTALQVDDPRLSLRAIKPGDPILTVPGRPDVVAVVAWYPFGVQRRLRFDERTGDFTDRFLVPRGWSDRSQRIEIFKHLRDGGVEHDTTWYRIDDTGPSASVRVDVPRGLLVLTAADAATDLATVQLHAGRGSTWLSPLRGEWTVPLFVLPESFTLLLRDRAGNRTVLRCTLESGRLEIHEPAVTSPPTKPVSALRLDGNQADAVRDHAARAHAPHPVTDAISMPDGSWLVGLLGKGLYSADREGLRRSRLRVGTRHVTSLAALGDQTFIGTATNGLWRVVSGRAYKTRFPHDHVFGLEVTPDGLHVDSGWGRFRRLGRDRFVRVGDGLSRAEETSPRMVGAVQHADRTWLTGFATGLHEWRDGRPVPVDLPLPVLGDYLNQIVSWDDDLYLASEGGLHVVSGLPDRPSVRRVMATATRGLAVGPDGLAVATTKGLFVLDSPHSPPHRVDGQETPDSYFTVAWWDDALWAGGMDGLFRFDSHGARQVTADEGLAAGWITALLPHRDTLLVGSYAEGVHELRAGRVQPLEKLDHHWTPPHGLSLVGDHLWAAGLGEAPMVIGADGFRNVPVLSETVALRKLDERSVLASEWFAFSLH
ncbi:MAG: VIT domain-containing protein [Acidobacteriota bacterium]